MINRIRDIKNRTRKVNIFLILFAIFMFTGILVAAFSFCKSKTINSFQANDYATLLVYIVFLPATLFLMKFIYKRINLTTEEVVEFYNQHPEYNTRKADFEIYKGLSVIDNYILHPIAIVDVQKSTDFYLEYVSSFSGRRMAHNILNFRDENGKNKSIPLNSLEDYEISSFRSYLLSYGNDLTVDPKNPNFRTK